ncbi:MAG: hypothetical protein ACK4M3_04705 [Pyrobaculum sp.]
MAFVEIVRSIALLEARRDYGVVFLDINIAGLKDVGENGKEPGLRPGESISGEYRQYLDRVEAELSEVVPTLKRLYPVDHLLKDTTGKSYVARFYTAEGIVYLCMLTSPHPLRKVVKRLTRQGWRLLALIEPKSVQKTRSETE